MRWRGCGYTTLMTRLPSTRGMGGRAGGPDGWRGGSGLATGGCSAGLVAGRDAGDGDGDATGRGGWVHPPRPRLSPTARAQEERGMASSYGERGSEGSDVALGTYAMCATSLTPPSTRPIF